MRKLKQRILLLLALFCICFTAIGQKKLIDTSVFGKWPTVEAQWVSNDGKFFIYNIHGQTPGSMSLIIRSTQVAWNKELSGQISGQFTQDSRNFILFKNDSLGIGELGKDEITWRSGSSDFRLFDKGKNDNWLFYRTNAAPDLLTIEDLRAGSKKIYTGINDYRFNELNQYAVLFSKSKSGNDVLQWLDMNTFRLDTIWEGRNPQNLKIKGEHLVFTGREVVGDSNSQLFYYQKGSGKVIKLSDVPLLEKDVMISGISAVSPDGKRIILNLEKKEHALIKKPGAVAVNVWNYKDVKLQSEQLLNTDTIQYLTGVFNLATNRLILLEQPGTSLLNRDMENLSLHDWALITKYDDFTGEEGVGEWNWNPHAKRSLYLISLNDGSLRRLNKDLEHFRLEPTCQLSPDEKYVIYYNAINGNYYSFSTRTGLTKNITSRIHTKWTAILSEDRPIAKYDAIGGIAGFLKNDHGVLLYDQYDIYQVDPEAKQPPICLTNSFGHQSHTQFRILDKTGTDATFLLNEKLLLTAFDWTTKRNGFYETWTGQEGKLLKLSMHDCFIDGSERQGGLLKARDTNVYVISKMTAASPLNYFLTSDFKSFKAMTDFHPERDYNWLTSELVTWKTLDGKIDQGILYKPENFDPQKKYPLIIHYYERKSNDLNVFLEPEYSGSVINIPYYVSHGYLVFTPDILFTLGSPGRSSYNCVVSAAEYLAKRPYVDAKKMALQGHSWGGFQTNYIISHTNLFAAAFSSSGMSDFVSIYNSIPGGLSRQRQYETGKDRMAATLWQIPQKYIENSPVLHADKVTTPLLMMANVEDTDVPYSQGTEFFTGLRRLGKKVWMLQYDHMGHMIIGGNAGKDLTIRVKQFFDHYLQDAPPPIWMTKGVPAKLKQVETGLELDTSGAIP